MLSGISALMNRSLTRDFRELRPQIARGLFVVFIFFTLLASYTSSSLYGAPGLRFFTNIAYLDVWVIMLAGLSYFASAITEEKEENTLGLLKMAGIDRMGILLGKSTSRLISALLILVLQVPFTLLAITLGGVTLTQIAASYLAIASFLIFAANAGLLCSVLSQRTGNAAAGTLGLFVLYFVTPYIAMLLIAWLAAQGITANVGPLGWGVTVLQWISTWGIFERLSEILAGGATESLIATQFWMNIGLGLICFALSRAMFEAFTQEATSTVAQRGMLTVSDRAATKRVSRPKSVPQTSLAADEAQPNGADRVEAASEPAAGRRIAWGSPGRCWDLALAWKDFNFITGGWPTFWMKAVLYPLTPIAIMLTANQVASMQGMTPNAISLNDYFYGLMILTCCAVPIELSILSSRLFHDELRLQTWPSLAMLPSSIFKLCYSKIAGCLLAVLPAAASLVIAAVGLTLINDHATGFHLDEVLVAPGFWLMLSMVLVFLHAVALVSLYLRWGALPATFMTFLILNPCCPAIPVFGIYVSGMQSNATDRAIVLSLIAMGTSFTLFVLQTCIGSRLVTLSSR